LPFSHPSTMSISNIRLLSQQLVAPLYEHPYEIVKHMGAMQAQEYRLMRWAVTMRTRKPSYEAFRKDYDEGRIIRLHLLRGTWQLVSADDYWWMLSLCREKAAKVIRGWMSASKITISEKEQDEIRELLVRKVEKVGSATKEDFAEALAEKDITMEDHRLSYHIRFCELDGILCSGDLHPSKATYSLCSNKIPCQKSFDKEEALALLTRKYFQSHAPATLEDFAWWSGLNISDCRNGVALLANELHQVHSGGADFLVHESCRTRGVHTNSTILLPSYDEYLIGYKSRHISLDPQHSHHAHSNNGIFFPVVVHKGKVCGNWTPFKNNPGIKYFEPDAAVLSTEYLWQQYLAARNQ